MSKCALPDHLKNEKHKDWLFPMSLIPRSFNAKGPRCGKGTKGYLPWPPKFLEGVGVTRWESLNGDLSVEIPEFEYYKTGEVVYGKEYRGFLNADKTKPYKLFIVPWRELKWPQDWQSGAQIWSPSAIQEYSSSGWMKLDPKFYARWHRLTKEKTFYFRSGWRPDHVDSYFNWGPYVGLEFE